MYSGELAKSIEATVKNPNISITFVTDDSRAVRSGALFFAIKGEKFNGEDFIKEALAKGAAGILTSSSFTQGIDFAGESENFCIMKSANPRRSFSLALRNFYPEQVPTIVAVTGTNGKTSTSVFCRQIWEYLHEPSASMGTIGIVSKYMNEEGNLTSPPPSLLYDYVSKLAHKGVRSLAIEASSHGIIQSRLDGLTLKAAGFTNLTRDHLDYHGTMDNYFHAKLRLFQEVLPPDGVAVINADIPEFNTLKAVSHNTGKKIISYGFKGKELKIINHKSDENGQNLYLEVLGKKYNIRLPLSGDFQAMNALCALGLCIGAGSNIEKSVEALETLQGANGRLEKVVTLSNKSSVYVDYAHTPDAIENVLNVLRPVAKSKLNILFGCGGDRDKGKRPMMGDIATHLADKVYVTDDNPRTENASAIRADIMTSCPKAVEIGDRQQAIYQAISDLSFNDILVLAGKGHETGQKIGNEIIPFNDKEEALKAAMQIDKKAIIGHNTAEHSIIWQTKELATVIGADKSLNGAGSNRMPNLNIYGLSTSLKNVKPADVFIALDFTREEKEDNHENVTSALDKGATVAIVHKSGMTGADLSKLMVVDNTKNALNKMATYKRFYHERKLIALFKNSVSENILKYLSSKYEIGVVYDKKINPIDTTIALAGLGNYEKYIVAELGGTNPKDLSAVSKTLQPDVIVITSEDRASNLTDIFVGAGIDAVLIIEDSNRNFSTIIKEAKNNGIRKILTFGFDKNADIPTSQFGEDRLGLLVEALNRSLQ